MKEYFTVREYRVKNPKKILFFFPAGFTQMWHYRLVIYWLNRKGISVIGFNFAWKKAIRECDFDKLISLIEEVHHSVEDVMAVNPDIDDYAVLGLSFGSVLALHSAKLHENIRSIILFVPYGTLSHLFWTHKPSRPFIETLLRNGLKTEKDLEELTQPIETQYHLEKLKDRRIVSFKGNNDKVVFDGQKLVDAIKKEGIEANFYESRFGHFGTSVVGLASKRKWTRVL